MSSQSSGCPTPTKCISSVEQRLLQFYLRAVKGRGYFVVSGASVGYGVFQVIWTVLEASGAVGRPLLCLLIAAVTLAVVTSLVAFRLARWTVLDFVIGRSLPLLQRYSPKVVIGVGRGGAHIAAMLCHKLAEVSGTDPVLLSIDRSYFLVDDKIETEINTLSVLRYKGIKQKGNVLLVAAEVHGGDTLRSAGDALKRNGVEYRSFAVLKSPWSRVRVDYCVLETDSRSLLPWPASPIRRTE